METIGNVGALIIIEQGFGLLYRILIIRNPKEEYDYLGFYITGRLGWCYG